MYQHMMALPRYHALREAVESVGALTEDGVSNVTTFVDEPPVFRLGGQLSSTDEWVGATGVELESTITRSYGEALERHGIAVSKGHKTVRCPQTELVGQFVPVNTFTDQLVENENVDYCTEHDSILWVASTNRAGEEVWLPAQAALYCSPDEEPYVFSKNTNGLACHESRVQATLAALCELVERDAFFLHYHSQLSAPRLGADSLNDDDRALIAKIERYRLKTELYVLDTGLGIPVVMAVLLDQSGHPPRMTLGFSAGWRTGLASSAICEALQLRGMVRSHLENPELDPRGSDMVSARAMLWAHASEDNLEFLFSNTMEINIDIEVPDWESFLNDFPHELHAVDLTPEGIEKFHVVKLVCPELFPLYFDDFLAPLKNPRLLDRLEGGKPLTTSHPFA